MVSISDELRGSVREYLWHLFDKSTFEFHFTSLHPSISLLSNSFALLLSSLLQFEDIPKERALSALLKCQGPNGLFSDPKLDADRSHYHDAAYVKLQQTFLALSALEEHSLEPVHPLVFLEPYKNEEFLTHWLTTLAWKDPWLVSNSVMFILKFLIFEHEHRGAECLPFAGFILDWLDRNQDPVTGFWNIAGTADLHNQLAAAYHFLFYYDYLSRPLHYCKQMIDSALALQFDTGLFSPYASGGACDDLDAIDVLARCAKRTEHRRDDIDAAFERAAAAILGHQNADGGFCYSRAPAFRVHRLFPPNLRSLRRYKGSLAKYWLQNFKWQAKALVAMTGRSEKWSFSGLPLSEIPMGSSDIFSTYFRMLSLAIAGTHLGDTSTIRFSQFAGFNFLT